MILMLYMKVYLVILCSLPGLLEVTCSDIYNAQSYGANNVATVGEYSN
jgi:hypothetical protein